MRRELIVLLVLGLVASAFAEEPSEPAAVAEGNAEAGNGQAGPMEQWQKRMEGFKAKMGPSMKEASDKFKAGLQSFTTGLQNLFKGFQKNAKAEAPAAAAAAE